MAAAAPLTAVAAAALHARVCAAPSEASGHALLQLASDTAATPQVLLARYSAALPAALVACVHIWASERLPTEEDALRVRREPAGGASAGLHASVALLRLLILAATSEDYADGSPPARWPPPRFREDQVAEANSAHAAAALLRVLQAPPRHAAAETLPLAADTLCMLLDRSAVDEHGRSGLLTEDATRAAVRAALHQANGVTEMEHATRSGACRLLARLLPLRGAGAELTAAGAAAPPPLTSRARYVLHPPAPLCAPDAMPLVAFAPLAAANSAWLADADALAALTTLAAREPPAVAERVLAWQAMGAIFPFHLPETAPLPPDTLSIFAPHVLARCDALVAAAAAGAAPFARACEALHTVSSHLAAGLGGFTITSPPPEPHLPQPPVEEGGLTAAALTAALCRGAWLHLADAAAAAAALECLVMRFRAVNDRPEERTVQLYLGALALHAADARVATPALAGLAQLLSLHALPAAERAEMRSTAYSMFGDASTLPCSAAEEARACGAPQLLIEAAAEAPPGGVAERCARHSLEKLGIAAATTRIAARRDVLQRQRAPPPAAAPLLPAEDDDGAGRDGSCALCLGAPRSHLLRPCSHLVACEPCTQLLLAAPGGPKCPLCRTRIVEVIRVFTT
jgi:hypothetical protein